MKEEECKRQVPTAPHATRRQRLLIDADAANEIDDLYAIALSLCASDRFDLVGFVATHFAARSGPESTQESHLAIEQTLHAAGAKYPIAPGGDPMCYPGVPRESDGARFIIDAAKQSSSEDRLLVLVLGAASNTASALMLEPQLSNRITVMFHGRSEDTWPERTQQFNIYGDVLATKYLLESDVPLIWFNTGTKLTAAMEETERRLRPLGPLGEFLHDYRYRNPWYQEPTKGFFDLGDVAWLLSPNLCQMKSVPAPTLTRWMYFDHEAANGDMLLVSDIDVAGTWSLFYERLSAFVSGTQDRREM